MATIVFPLLLIFAGLGGILIIVGRKLPDIRRAMGEAKREPEATVDNVLPLAPRTTTIEQPRSGRSARFVSGARTRLGAAARALGRGVRAAGRGGRRTFTVFSRVFSRVPTKLRIPQPGTRHGIARREEPAPSANPPVPTTSDIRRSEHPPLRFPEPLPPEASSAAQARERLAPISEKRDADVPAHAVPTTAASAPVTASPSVVLEEARERKTRKQRRVIGRIRTRRAPTVRIEPPASVPPISVLPAEPEEAPAPPPRPRSDIVGVDRPPAWSSTAQTIPALIDEGNYERAEALLIDILSKNPRDTEAYRLLGTLYLRRKEYPQAKEVFEEALRRDPSYPGLYGPLGLSYISLGEYSKALSVYQRAHDMDETNIEYLEQLLMISSRMDRRPLVRVAAKKLLALDPNNEKAKKTLAQVEAR